MDGNFVGVPKVRQIKLNKAIVVLRLRGFANKQIDNGIETHNCGSGNRCYV